MVVSRHRGCEDHAFPGYREAPQGIRGQGGQVWDLVLGWQSQKLKQFLRAAGVLWIECLSADGVLDILDHCFESLWRRLFHDHLSCLLYRTVEHVLEDRAHTSEEEPVLFWSPSLLRSLPAGQERRYLEEDLSLGTTCSANQSPLSTSWSLCICLPFFSRSNSATILCWGFFQAPVSG